MLFRSVSPLLSLDLARSSRSPPATVPSRPAPLLLPPPASPLIPQASLRPPLQPRPPLHRAPPATTPLPGRGSTRAAEAAVRSARPPSLPISAGNPSHPTMPNDRRHEESAAPGTPPATAAAANPRGRRRHRRRSPRAWSLCPDWRRPCWPCLVWRTNTGKWKE